MYLCYSSKLLPILQENKDRIPPSIVSGFNGDESELAQLLELDHFVAVSGCFFNNDKSVNLVKKIPVKKLILESNCPNC